MYRLAQLQHRRVQAVLRVVRAAIGQDVLFLLGMSTSIIWHNLIRVSSGRAIHRRLSEKKSRFIHTTLYPVSLDGMNRKHTVLPHPSMLR